MTVSLSPLPRRMSAKSKHSRRRFFIGACLPRVRGILRVVRRIQEDLKRLSRDQKLCKPKTRLEQPGVEYSVSAVLIRECPWGVHTAAVIVAVVPSSYQDVFSFPSLARYHIQDIMEIRSTYKCSGSKLVQACVCTHAYPWDIWSCDRRSPQSSPLFSRNSSNAHIADTQSRSSCFEGGW